MWEIKAQYWKDTRKTETHFTQDFFIHCSSVSIANFEHDLNNTYMSTDNNKNHPLNEPPWNLCKQIDHT